jgi:hypothetical protein
MTGVQAITIEVVVLQSEMSRLTSSTCIMLMASPMTPKNNMGGIYRGGQNLNFFKNLFQIFWSPNDKK